MKFSIDKTRGGWLLSRILENGKKEKIATYKTTRGAETRMMIERDRLQRESKS